jgi:predicted nuclease of predicted toxin-antitoxin system
MKPAFLANENFPRQSVLLLRLADLRVDSIVEMSPGISDDVVMSNAARNNLIILTFDRDYGELIFKYRQSCPAGIVYFRTGLEQPESPARLLLLLMKNITFEGFFSVIDINGIRQRPL